MAYNPYENVLKVMDEAAQILGYSESDIEPLKYPERELKVSVPVVMDDGSSIPHPADRPRAVSVSIRR